MSEVIPPDSTVATVEPEDNFKVCADCVHLLGVRYREPTNWKCGHSNNIKPVEDKTGWRVDLVTGLKHRIFKIDADLYNVRMNHCKGDWYEKYVPPVRESQPMELTEEPSFNAEALRETREAAKAAIERRRKEKLAKQGLAGIDPKEL